MKYIWEPNDIIQNRYICLSKGKKLKVITYVGLAVDKRPDGALWALFTVEQGYINTPRTKEALAQYLTESEFVPLEVWYPEVAENGSLNCNNTLRPIQKTVRELPNAYRDY